MSSYDRADNWRVNGPPATQPIGSGRELPAADLVRAKFSRFINGQRRTAIDKAGLISILTQGLI
jgi:hypothetical protein